jgi:SAM-dependent methyltransferase
MGRYSSELSPQMADLAGVKEGQRVLDVGSGPGALTEELVRRVGADRVAAIDPSPSFVAAVAERYGGVDARQGSAETLPYENQSFDVAIAQLVVHFMNDPLAGLREMRRVTRSGGVVAACVWDHAARRSPIGPFWDAAHRFDPDLDDEADLPGARQGHLADLFETAGLREITQRTLTVSVEHAAFDDWWEPFTLGVGPAGKYVASLEDERRHQIRDLAREALGPGPFRISGHAWAVRGEV